jgi:hypothetical protein
MVAYSFHSAKLLTGKEATAAAIVYATALFGDVIPSERNSWQPSMMPKPLFWPWQQVCLAQAFALRFKELLGETPLEYLTSWRMYKAIGPLQKDDRKLLGIAKSVGYDSDAAFSKTFKRVLGVAPREYRRSATEARRS